MIVHYYRYGGDYEGWNVWVWLAGSSGGDAGGFMFEKSEPGDGFMTARIFFPAESAAKAAGANNNKEFGVIIRRSEHGNDWAEKDIAHDRFTGEKEIWLVQGDPAVYESKPNIADPPILFAAADSSDAVMLALPVELSDYSVFAVYENGRRLEGKSEQASINNELSMRGDAVASGYDKAKVIVSLSEKIKDPALLYTVRDESGFFSEQKVTMRGILDSYYYDGDDLGLTYRVDESRFKVWAPSASAVSVALYDSAGEYNAAGRVADQETGDLRPMAKDAATGVWSISVQGNLEGKFYLYRVTFAGGTAGWAADPYAKAVSANGQRMAIVDLAKTNPGGWKAKPKPPFTAGAWQDAVIYEVHVRDFSIDEHSGMKHKGKFLAFTERGTTVKGAAASGGTASGGTTSGVDHLVNLGITHVHLLPVFDFASINELAVDDPNATEPKCNWGYDPMHYNVPEGSYSTDPKNPSARIAEFKQMVHALHDAGIRVIMDVVYNHTFQIGAWPFDALVPGYYYRTTDTGVYANGSGCGNEVASERPMVRKFIIDSCRYWASEYAIDGFRFDLMGIIDTPTMKQLTEELRGIDPAMIIYGEPWQAGGSILPEGLQTGIGAQKGLGFAIFNDRIRTAIKGGSDDNSRGFATGAPSMEAGIVLGVMGSINDFTGEANESVNYVTAHDNLNLWDKMAYSLGASDLARNPYSLLEGKASVFDSDAVKSVLLSNGIVFTSQGIPFFQAGDEFLRSKFGDHNSYASSDDINKIRWENAYLYREVVDYYAGLIRLRKAYRIFRQTTRESIERSMEILSAGDMGVSFIIRGAAPPQTVFVAYNGSSQPKAFALPGAVPVWRQLVDARRAGIETLAECSGSVTLPPLSIAVLVQ